MNARKVARPETGGFTLVEVMLAACLTALILVSLHAAVSSGVRSYRRAQELSERELVAWATIHLLSEDLQRASVGAPGGPAALIGVADVGGGPMLRLRALARRTPGTPGAVVDWFFVPSGPGRSGEASGLLARRSQLLDGPARVESAGQLDDEGDEGPRFEVVAAGLKQVRLRYFDGQQWRDEWIPGDVPPRLVELTLEFAGSVEPEEIVRALPVVVEGPLLPAAGTIP